eukprot:TRINITY_DN19950_c0_g1_i1.p1 TRINITY_DN19950_c0_g1~~TRINITY_DN19950_c0_g1_i1.p1  ORF type:complete len:736 (-),score=87.34 TRINITY_DN19950_c0_g1_i1:44-2251(-)
MGESFNDERVELPRNIACCRSELEVVSVAGSMTSPHHTDEDRLCFVEIESAVPVSPHDGGSIRTQGASSQGQIVTPAWEHPFAFSSNVQVVSDCRDGELMGVEESRVEPYETFLPTNGNTVTPLDGAHVAWGSPRRPWTAGPVFYSPPSAPPPLPLAWPPLAPEKETGQAASSSASGDAIECSICPQLTSDFSDRASWLDDVVSLRSDPTFTRTSRVAIGDTRKVHSRQRRHLGRGTAEALGVAAFAAVGELGVSEEVRLGASRLLVGVGRRASDAIRSAGGISPSDDEELDTFLCLVCFENKRVDERLVLGSCEIPEHGCCMLCAASFFRSRIEQGRVFELQCPIGAAEGGCRPKSLDGDLVSSEPESAAADPFSDGNGVVRSGKVAATASRKEVEAVFANDAATLEKYRRFVRTKVDSRLRECPDCQHLCSPEVDEGFVPTKEMKCLKCGCLFCYYHAAAHRGGSCEEYEVRLAAETHVISAKLGTKDCPRCGRQTMKTGGCNHMTCQVCRCDWCWICGIAPTRRGPHGEDAMYWHFCDDNTESGCRQFVDPGRHPDAESVRLWRRERRPGSVVRKLAAPARLVSVFLVIFSAVLALVLWLIVYTSAVALAGLAECVARGAVGVCRSCGSVASFDDLAFAKSQVLIKPTLYPAVAVGTVVFLVPFVAFSFVWAVLSVVVWVPLWLFGRLPLLRRCVPLTSRHHLRFLATAPLRSVHQFGSSTFARMVADAPPH